MEQAGSSTVVRLVRIALPAILVFAVVGCASTTPPSAAPTTGAPATETAAASSAGTSAGASNAAPSAAPSKLDPLSFPDRSVTPIASYAVPGAGGLAASTDAIWSLGQGVLQRLDPATGRVTTKVTVPGPVASEGDEGLGWLTFGAGVLWATDFDTSLVYRLDPRTGRTTATASVDHPEGIAVVNGVAWVASHRTGTLVALDPQTTKAIATVTIGPVGNSGPLGVWPISGTIWSAVPNANEIVGVDPAARSVAATVTGLPNPCGYMSAVASTMWVSECGRSVERVDLAKGRYVSELYVGGFVGAPQPRPDGVWLPIEPPPNQTTPARLLKIGPDGSPLDAIDLGPGCVPTLGPPSVLAALGSIWIGCDNGTILKLATTDLP